MKSYNEICQPHVSNHAHFIPIYPPIHLSLSLSNSHVCISLLSTTGNRREDEAEEIDEDLLLDISPMDVSPSDPTRHAVWELVRSSRFETLILLAILCNCVQLTLYDPKVRFLISLLTSRFCVSFFCVELAHPVLTVDKA